MPSLMQLLRRFSWSWESSSRSRLVRMFVVIDTPLCMCVRICVVPLYVRDNLLLLLLLLYYYYYYYCCSTTITTIIIRMTFLTVMETQQ